MVNVKRTHKKRNYNRAKRIHSATNVMSGGSDQTVPYFLTKIFENEPGYGASVIKNYTKNKKLSNKIGTGLKGLGSKFGTGLKGFGSKFGKLRSIIPKGNKNKNSNKENKPKSSEGKLSKLKGKFSFSKPFKKGGSRKTRKRLKRRTKRISKRL